MARLTTSSGRVSSFFGVALGAQSARIAAVAIGERALRLAGCHDDVGGIDDDDVVAGVDMRGEDRAVLATKHTGDLGSEPAQDEPVSVDPRQTRCSSLGFGEYVRTSVLCSVSTLVLACRNRRRRWNGREPQAQLARAGKQR